MTIHRRDFLKSGVSAAMLSALPRPLLARLGARDEPVPPIDDPRLRALAARALDAARGAGATYADVRLTHTRLRRVDPGAVNDREIMAAGVRVLANGYWGFASSPVWSPDEMARLGSEAMHQARANALGGTRTVELAPARPIQAEHWAMPVAIDPFEVSPFEIQDVLSSLALFAQLTPGAGVSTNECWFTVVEKAFASTDGSYCTQRTYNSTGRLDLVLERRGARSALALDCLTPAGLGWELYRAERLPLVRSHSMREAIQRTLAEIEEDMALPVKAVDVGLYDVVFDARSMSSLAGETLGRATELDRVLGYEANAGGTSFLTDPLAILGTLRLGPPLLTLSADRSTPGAAATVRWDDEGVSPDVFPLISEGVLQDFQTTRESAAWIAPFYQKAGRPLRSHGCANAPSAVNAPVQHSPNLVLAPAAEALDFEGLVGGISNGVAVKDAVLDMDFQAASGLLTGRMYEVKRGRRTARFGNAGILFRTTELWKGLRTLGGAASARRYGTSAVKGQPPQEAYSSVTAVPAAVKQLKVVDPLRKA